MDVLFISPGNSNGIYQKLSNKYSSIEPPTWALLLAESCRSIGFSVSLIDVNAEKLTNDEVLERINQNDPYTNIPGFTNNFQYIENITAVYTQFGTKFFKKLSVYIRWWSSHSDSRR